MVKTIDILGLKNFRIFDDQNGFLEEFAAINILTGANNSGKSSIVKALQMLKNSVKGFRYPFDLDLNQQEHLLGDFNNVLYNKANKKIDVSVPFLFFGITNLYVSLSFIIPDSKNPYQAKLRSIEVIDKHDKRILFSFRYREANDEEKIADKQQFEQNLKAYEQEAAETSLAHSKITPLERITNGTYVLPPDDNPLAGYVDYTIDLERLKDYFSALQPYYAKYLENKSDYDEEELERIDGNAEDKKLFCIPSVVLKGFKQELDPQKWKDFIENTLKDQKEITGQETVGDRDFDQDEGFLLKPEIEHNLYQKALSILRNNLVWEDDDKEHTYAVIEKSFRMSWDSLIRRISSINYISNIKEENSRGYNAASSSPFISLLKAYLSLNIDTEFLERYLKAFEIGTSLTIDHQPKYQLLLVSINTLDGSRRELVDFGYGIKQIILILIQVSVLATQNKRVEYRYSYHGDGDHTSYEPSLLIVEEPESNLHPKWQSLLADMLSEASRRFNIQLLIETHSEYLIRKFQTLVAKKTEKSQDVKIFYLRSLRNVTSEKKQVENLNIQENGSIDFNLFDSGFFDESYKLDTSLLNIQFYKEFEDLKNAQQQGANTIQENENEINALQQKIDQFVSKADVTVYRQMILNQFPNSTKLDVLSVDYLVAGQYLLENNDNSIDFSPVIMQYGRTIENELKRIFKQVAPAIKWTIGPMQKLLEKVNNPSLTIERKYNSAFGRLAPELARVFHVPGNLRIDLIDDLREIRNSAGHAGLIKTKQEAVNYIAMANAFLNTWISEKKS